MSEQVVRPREVLTQDEVRLLQRALGEWGGPARGGDELAFAGNPAKAGQDRERLRRKAPERVVKIVLRVLRAGGSPRGNAQRSAGAPLVWVHDLRRLHGGTPHWRRWCRE